MTIINLRHVQAEQLRAKGMTYAAIAAYLQISPDTAHMWADPEYRKRRHGGRHIKSAYIRPRKSAKHARVAEIRWSTESEYFQPRLPTVPYVPKLEPSENARYQMVAP